MKSGNRCNKQESLLYAELNGIKKEEMLELAVDSLLLWVDLENPYLRRYVARSLGLIGTDRAVEPLIARLDHADADVRYAMVGALSSKLEEIDKKLLSSDLDGIFPFLDPHEEISPSL